MRARPLRLGLTGGIGSGKSTVGQFLARRGAALIDADAIARSVTAPGGAAMEAIANEFGPAFVNAQGALDRERMRALAFEDPLAKRRLEAIVHPLVGQAIDIAAQHATASGHTCLVFDIPLLVESGRWRGQLDRVLVIDCSAQTQMARVQARSNLKTEAIQAIIAAQATRVQRLAAADLVIFNEGVDLVELERLTSALLESFGL